MPIIKSQPWVQQDAINLSLYNRTITGPNRYVTSGEIAAMAGTGTVTSISAGGNIILQPAVITTTGSIALTDSLSIPGNVQISGELVAYQPIYAYGNVQASGGLTVYGPLRTVGTNSDRVFVGETKQTIVYGDYADAQGNSWYLAGSGVVTYGSAKFNWPAILLKGAYSGTVAAANRYVTSGELKAGTGTVTSVVAGSNLVIQPSPLTVTGSIGLLPDVAISTLSATPRPTAAGTTVAATTTLDTTATDGTYYGMRSQVLTDNGTTQDLSGINLYGLSVSVRPRGASSVVGNALYGIDATVNPAGGALYNSAYGIYTQVRLLQSGTVDYAYGLYIGSVEGTVGRWGVYQLDPDALNQWLGPTEFDAGVQLSGLTIAYQPLYQGAISQSSRYITSGELAAGTGSVTSITVGSNLTSQPSPITTTGSIALSNSLSVPGDVQISGASVLYGTLNVGGKATITDAAGSRGMVVYNPPVIGNSLYLRGSGLFAGQQVFSPLTPNDAVFMNALPIYQGASAIGSRRYVTSGELAGGSGSVTSITVGSNLTAQPNPITTTGSIGLANALALGGTITQTTSPSTAESAVYPTATLANGSTAGSYYAYRGSLRTSLATTDDLTGHTLYGYAVQIQHRGASTSDLNTMYGGSYSVFHAGGGNVGTAYGLSVAATTTSSGTISEAYGLYIGAVTGTTEYGVYQSDASNLNYWAGTSQFLSGVQISGELVTYQPIYAYGNVQASGGLVAYDDLLAHGTFRKTVGTANDRIILGLDRNTIFYGDYADAQGNSWYLAGSGVVTYGSAKFNWPAILLKGAYSGTVAAANRYVTSGELKASTGTFDPTQSEFWTGPTHVFSSTTTVTLSGLTRFGADGTTCISPTGDMQVSGAIAFYDPSFSRLPYRKYLTIGSGAPSPKYPNNTRIQLAGQSYTALEFAGAAPNAGNTVGLYSFINYLASGSTEIARFQCFGSPTPSQGSFNILVKTSDTASNPTIRFSINPSATSIVGGTKLLADTQISGSAELYSPLIMHSGIGSPVAPGASNGMLRWESGTNPGTLKLVAYAGTSTTGSTIIDNVGSGS